MSLVSIPFDPPQLAGVVTYPVSALWTLHYFDSATHFKAIFGVDPPPYDPTKRQKFWFDTSVDLSDPNATVIYYAYRHGPTGIWSYQPIAMPASEAAAVNFPPASQPSGSATPGEPWPVPARALLPNEKLDPNAFGLWIQNTDLLNQQQGQQGGFTADDRSALQQGLALLQKIALKVGA